LESREQDSNLNESQKPILSGSPESDPEDLLDIVVGAPKPEPKVSDTALPSSAAEPVKHTSGRPGVVGRAPAEDATEQSSSPAPKDSPRQDSGQPAWSTIYATVKYQIVPATASYASPLNRHRTTALTTTRTTALTTTRTETTTGATALTTTRTAALAPRSRGDVAERYRLNDADAEQYLTGPAPAPAEEVQENWFKLLLKETAETIVLAVIIFLLIRIGIQNYRIEGSSMEPNFHHGEYLLVNKLAYRLGEYQRGDVIVFQYPGDISKDYIKRIVGLPGDTVEIRDGILSVNGIVVQEPYATMPMHSFPSGPTTVEPGYLYVLGDNRPASSDTRDWGLLNQELVIGKAWLAIFPVDQFGLVEHPQLQFTPGMAQGP
jgi:signal peptidase I